MVNGLQRVRMNRVLSGIPLQRPENLFGGALMPSQRKVFRIEEMLQGETPMAFPQDDSEHAARHAEMMAELRSLRSMMTATKPGDAVVAPEEQKVVEIFHAQAAEARKLKIELDVIDQAIKKTKGEMVSLQDHGLDGGQMARVTQELAAVKVGTTDATDRILKAAETIEQTSSTLAAALKGAHEQGMAQDIQVVGQRCRGVMRPCLQRTDGQAVRTGLDEQAEDLQAPRVRERLERSDGI